MSDLTNITVNGMPLAEALRQQRLSEVQEHFATEEADLRRKLARGRSTPVPLAARKRGRNPIEIRNWGAAEIQRLATDESLSVAEIASHAGQPERLVGLCLRQLHIKRKRGRKKRVPAADQWGAIRGEGSGEALISDLPEFRDAA
jgi:hypothetical protein